MILDIEQRYAEIERYIAGNGGAAVDPPRAMVHAMVVAFLASNPLDGQVHFVMDLPPTDPDAWRIVGRSLGPVAYGVSESLKRLGYTVEFVVDQPAHMRARKG